MLNKKQLYRLFRAIVLFLQPETCDNLMNITGNIGKYLLVLLLPAMVLFTHNHLANWHYHISPNGVPVKHAHPFNKTDNPASPFAGHSHTAMEMLFYGQFSLVVFTLALALSILGLILQPTKQTRLSQYTFPFLEQLACSLPLLRAPPEMIK